jgi:hypothetical protein
MLLGWHDGELRAFFMARVLLARMGFFLSCNGLAYFCIQFGCLEVLFYTVEET